MALLWIDGFDHYSAPADAESVGRLNMLDGAWAAAAVGGPSETYSRTGGQSLHIPSFSQTSADNYRRIFGSGLSTVGFGFAIYMPTLASLIVGRAELFALTDSGNLKQLTFNLLATGAIEVRQGGATGTLLGTTPDGTLVATAWQHVEVKAVISPTVGAVEIRVNGVTVISLSGVNTGPATANNLTFMRNASAFFQEFDVYLDDIYAWDITGTYNNDFVGDKRVLSLMPTDDTAVADWAITGAASGYAAISEIPPDDDVSYIDTQIVGQQSAFQVADLVGLYGAISAVMTTPLSRKTVAGTCNLQVSLLSGAAEAPGADRPITENYTYYTDMFEQDPNTAAPWTQAAINAMQMRIKRTA